VQEKRLTCRGRGRSSGHGRWHLAVRALGRQNAGAYLAFGRKRAIF
jgi:hypothetical protein